MPPGSLTIEIKPVEPGKVMCFKRATIDRWLENFLACLTFATSIYVGLKIVNLLFFVELNPVYHSIGYISTTALISVPLAFKGAKESSYKLLFLFFVILWYHMYGFFSYIWLNTREGPGWAVGLKLLKPLAIHQVVLVVYGLALFFCFLSTLTKIVSIAVQVEPAKVAVTDNNAND